MQSNIISYYHGRPQGGAKRAFATLGNWTLEIGPRNKIAPLGNWT